MTRASSLCSGVGGRAATIVGPPVAHTCQACRRGDHVDHQAGIWRRADGSDPVLCVCRSCNWYRCGICGEGCRDFPRFEHAGRCFPSLEPAAVVDEQLSLAFGTEVSR